MNLNNLKSFVVQEYARESAAGLSITGPKKRK